MPHSVAETDWRLADVALQAGEVAAARTLTHRAAAVALTADHSTWWTPGLLETAARIAAFDDANHLAARLGGAASCFRASMNLSRPAMANEFYNDFFAEVRNDLGHEYELAFLEGELLSMREALELITTELVSGPSSTS